MRKLFSWLINLKYVTKKEIFYKKFVKIQLIILIVFGVLFGGSALSKNLKASYFPLIIRDATIFFWANYFSGDIIPIEGVVDYNHSEFFDSWYIITNSQWLLNQTMLIVPLTSFEGLTIIPIYPAGVGFVPRAGDDSVNNFGRVINSVELGGAVVSINERYLVENADLRELLSVAIHENIHVQEGNFTFSGKCGDNIVCWGSESTELEAKTSAATIEILAAMCNLGNEVACKSFWLEVRDFAGNSLNYTLQKHNLSDAWQWFRNVFMRTNEEVTRRDKILRYWESDEEKRAEIIFKYSVHPWNDLIIPGLCGKPLNTGIINFTNTERPDFMRVLGFKFDDTKYIFGWLNNILGCKKDV